MSSLILLVGKSASTMPVKQQQSSMEQHRAVVTEGGDCRKLGNEQLKRQQLAASSSG
jgi:hypothetical protein